MQCLHVTHQQHTVYPRTLQSVEMTLYQTQAAVVDQCYVSSVAAPNRDVSWEGLGLHDIDKKCDIDYSFGCF